MVYFHDANRRRLFGRENRALASGRVWVRGWVLLLAFVLDMDFAAIHALASGRGTCNSLAQPIPVTRGDVTRFPDAGGQIATCSDAIACTDLASAGD